MVNDVSPDDVMKAVAETKLLLVDCWAPWCGPCLTLSPILEELEQKYADNEDVKFLKVNTQDHKQFASDNDIRAIPCVLVYHNGKLADFDFVDFRTGEPSKTDRIIGLRPPEHYEEVIKQLLK